MFVRRLFHSFVYTIEHVCKVLRRNIETPCVSLFSSIVWRIYINDKVTAEGYIFSWKIRKNLLLDVNL